MKKNGRKAGRKISKRDISRINKEIQRRNTIRIVFFLILLIFAIIGFITVIGKLPFFNNDSQTITDDRTYVVGGDAQTDETEAVNEDQLREAMKGITSKEGFTDKLQKILVATEDAEIYTSTDDSSSVSATVRAGEYVNFYGSEDGWYKLSYQGSDGYGKAEIFQEVEGDNLFKVVDGVLIVNEEYGLPQDYEPGPSLVAQQSFELMKSDMERDNMALNIASGYRTYEDEEGKNSDNLVEYGEEIVSSYNFQPGHSEHQTGLAIDVTNDGQGNLNTDFAETKEYEWISNNAHKYGFIIRYPRSKENFTGKEFQPWHLRYLGPDTAKKIYQSGLTIEEYYDL